MIQFLIGLVLGIGLMAHHYKKYRVFLHFTLPDHGVYGVALLVAGSVGLLI